MNRLICLLVTPLLLGGGVVCAQPTWDEGESFEAFRDEWNGWVESLPNDERVFPDLREVLDRINDHERNLKLSEEIQEWPDHALTSARPWNGQWVHLERVRAEFQPELDLLLEIVEREHLGARIPTVIDHPDFDPDELYLPTRWIEEHAYTCLSEIRSAISILTTEGVYQASSGNQGGALRLFEAAAVLSERGLELPSELASMVERATGSLYRGVLIELLEFNPDIFTDGQLAQIQRLFVLDLTTDYRRVWEFDQRMMHADWRLQFESMDFARTNRELRELFLNQASVHKGFGTIYDYLDAFDSPDPDADTPLAKLSDQVSVHSRMVEAMLRDFGASPATQREPALSNAMRTHLSGRDANRFLPVYVDVAIWRLQLGFFHRENYKTANQIAALSIYRHRARHGVWPLSLRSIDPGVLPIPAIDYYSGEPLRYALVNNQPRLWALGVDRDDDGGRIKRAETSTVNPAYKWFALDEWDALSDEQRADRDGDIRILY